MKAGGVSEYFMPDGTVRRFNTKKCVHCQTMVEYETQRDLTNVMDFCRNCMGMICLPCAGLPCSHHMREIEKIEKNFRRHELRRALGIE